MNVFVLLFRFTVFTRLSFTLYYDENDLGKKFLIVSGTIKGVAACAAILLGLYLKIEAAQATKGNFFSDLFGFLLLFGGFPAAIVATSELFVGGYWSR